MRKNCLDKEYIIVEVKQEDYIVNIKEALKIILCDSQKGVDYNKFIKLI